MKEIASCKDDGELVLNKLPAKNNDEKLKVKQEIPQTIILTTPSLSLKKI